MTKQTINTALLIINTAIALSCILSAPVTTPTNLEAQPVTFPADSAPALTYGGASR